MRRNAVGSSEENAEGRTAYEQQLTELEWAVEDGEEYLRVEKKKGELLGEELAASEREKAALFDENRLLAEDYEMLRVRLDAERHNHFHTRLELQKAKHDRMKAESDLAEVASPKEAAARVSANNYQLRNKIVSLTRANEELRNQMRQSHADLQNRESTILALQCELDGRAADVTENFGQVSGAPGQ